MNFYENLTNNLYNFFTCLPEHVERWDAAVEKTLPEIVLLMSLAESYVDLKQSKKLFIDMADKDSELVHAQQRTATTIAMGLEEAMSRIRKNQNAIEETRILNAEVPSEGAMKMILDFMPPEIDTLFAVVDDLLTKFDSIEKAASKVPDIDSAGNFYIIPRLNRLREYAEDATKFYQTLYLQIDTSMSNVDYNEILSIKDVHKTWDQKASSHPHIREILAFATFANRQTAA